MRKWHAPLLALVLCASSYAQELSRAEAPEDADYRMLHGERVTVVASSTNSATWVSVRFRGDEPEIKYSDVTVQGFDKDGKEFPLGQSAAKAASYMALHDAGPATPVSYMGMYTSLRGIVSVSKVKVSWKGEVCEFRVPALLKDPEYKMLNDEQVRVELWHNAENKPVLQVTFRGAEPDVKYSDVKVKAFDKQGKEIPVATLDVFNNDSYTNVGFGKYRGDSNIGEYKPSGLEKDIFRVTIAWRGAEVEFAPLTKPKHLTFKPFHGGQVSVSIIGSDGGPKMLQVMLKGISEPEVQYGQIALTVINNNGSSTRSDRLTGDRETYMQLSRKDGVLMGMYKAPNAEKGISKIALEWGDDEIDFAAAELVPIE